jgi:hypothetical protein
MILSPISSVQPGGCASRRRQPEPRLYRPNVALWDFGIVRITTKGPDRLHINKRLWCTRLDPSRRAAAENRRQAMTERPTVLKADAQSSDAAVASKQVEEVMTKGEQQPQTRHGARTPKPAGRPKPSLSEERLSEEQLGQVTGGGAAESLEKKRIQ